MNTYLKYQPPAVQFLSFLMFAGGFFFIDFAIASFFYKDLYAVLVNKPENITPELITEFKWSQFITSSISFIIPALLFGYYSSPKALPYIGLQKTVSPVMLGVSVGLLFCIQPFIGWLGNVNSNISFGSMQKSLEAKEAIYNRAIQVFLQMNSVGDLFINLLVMALLPAVGEELFFRGSLQKALLRLNKKPWLAILITAIVFGLLHGTYFKLLPIFALGLLLGIVYHLTQNLWYCITIHFINNALAVILVYFSNRSETLRNLANDNFIFPWYSAIISLAAGVGIIYFIKSRNISATVEEDDINDNDDVA